MRQRDHAKVHVGGADAHGVDDVARVADQMTFGGHDGAWIAARA